MKFSAIAVLLIAAPASSFVPLKNKVFTRSQTLFAIEDLEAKLLAPPATPSKPAAKVVKPKPKPVEKPKPIEKPKPPPKVKPEPSPKPAPKIEAKKEPVKVQVTTKKAAIVVEKPKPIAVVKEVAPPKKPSESDPNAGPLGVALGSAPLLLAPLVALSAGREILTKTAARRAEIEAEIKAAEAARAKKLTQVEVDKAGLAKAGVFLGGAVVSLGLILSNPFGGIELPSSSQAPVTKSAFVSKVPEISSPKKVSPKVKALFDQGYNFEGVQQENAKAADALADSKEAQAKAQAERQASIKAKALAAEKEAAEKKAATEAKAKAAAAEREEKLAAAAAKKEAEAQAKLAKAQATKVEVTKAVIEEEKANQIAEAEKIKAAALEADKKAAEVQEAKAMEQKLAAEEKAKEEAAAAKKAELEAASKKVAAEREAAKAAAEEKAFVATETAATKALGVVTGSESGGRVLPKEEVSADVLKMLKKYN